MRRCELLVLVSILWTAPALAYGPVGHLTLSLGAAVPASDPATDATDPTEWILATVCPLAATAPWASRSPQETVAAALGWRRALPTLPWERRIETRRTAWRQGAVVPEWEGWYRDRRERGRRTALDPLILYYGPATGPGSDAWANRQQVRRVRTLPWLTFPGTARFLLDLGPDEADLRRPEAGLQAALAEALARLAAPRDATVAAFLDGVAVAALQHAASPARNLLDDPQPLLAATLAGIARGAGSWGTVRERIRLNVVRAAELLTQSWALGGGPDAGRLAFATAPLTGRPSLPVTAPLTLWADRLAQAARPTEGDLATTLWASLRLPYRSGVALLPSEIERFAWHRYFDPRVPEATWAWLGRILGRGWYLARYATERYVQRRGQIGVTRIVATATELLRIRVRRQAERLRRAGIAEPGAGRWPGCPK